MNYGQITQLFRQEGYEWLFKDGKRVPAEPELEKTIWAAIDALAPTEDNTQIEVGRLIVKKKGSFYDIYMHVASELVVSDGA
jgi:hypothetical protein